MSTLSRAWSAAGKPYHMAQPIADLAATLRGYGYTIGTIGNDSHLQHNPPEDHTPFSTTGWPGASPYPYVHAMDIMPAGKSVPTLSQLGVQLVADRNAGLPGAAWIKYINWTPAGLPCRHESWSPVHNIKPSNDVGHIHISCRSDFTHSSAAAGYDPVARVRHTPPREVDVQLPTLKRGAKGQGVKNLQGLLLARGQTVDIDGDFGSGTELAVKAVQTFVHIGVDGIAGDKTWTALLAAV